MTQAHKADSTKQMAFIALAAVGVSPLNVEASAFDPIRRTTPASLLIPHSFQYTVYAVSVAEPSTRAIFVPTLALLRRVAVHQSVIPGIFSCPDAAA